MPADDLAVFLRRNPAVLLIVDDGDPAFEARLPRAVRGTTIRLSELTDPVRGAWTTVVFATRDRACLRRAVGGLPMVGRARVLACWIAEGEAPLVLHPRREWATLNALVARPTGDGGYLTVARFAEPVPAVPFLVELARQAVPWTDAANGGLVLGRVGARNAPGLDAGLVVGADAEAAADGTRDVPPDVVVTSSRAELPVHHVIDRAPALVSAPILEPVDEMIINPIGFRKDWDQPTALLRPTGMLSTTAGDVDLSRGLTEHALAALRGLQGVQVQWGGVDLVPAVAGLAMGGVPVSTQPPEACARQLGPELSAALASPVDLDDSLARHEHSVRAGRAAMDEHSTLSWRARLAATASVRFRALPAVSVLLATKRPHQLDFALRQMGRQRGADLELVIAAHGFEPDAGRVRAALGDRSVTVLSLPESTLFGDVLTAAAGVASGEVLLKIDDDDWYSPDFVHDLLLARRYSGADLVGMPAEFVYLEQLDVTVRRNHPVERYGRFVAGGTLLVDRSMLRAVGDFRSVRRFVDAQLLAAVKAAGGRMYRTHGFGYLLRRGATGHTWAQDPEEFRKEGIVAQEWPGFRPSALMEVLAQDRPAVGGTDPG